MCFGNPPPTSELSPLRAKSRRGGGGCLDAPGPEAPGVPQGGGRYPASVVTWPWGFSAGVALPSRTRAEKGRTAPTPRTPPPLTPLCPSPTPPTPAPPPAGNSPWGRRTHSALCRAAPPAGVCSAGTSGRGVRGRRRGPHGPGARGAVCGSPAQPPLSTTGPARAHTSGPHVNGRQSVSPRGARPWAGPDHREADAVAGPQAAPHDGRPGPRRLRDQPPGSRRPGGSAPRGCPSPGVGLHFRVGEALRARGSRSRCPQTRGRVECPGLVTLKPTSKERCPSKEGWLGRAQRASQGLCWRDVPAGRRAL